MKQTHAKPSIRSAEPFRPESPIVHTMNNGVQLYAFKRGIEEIVKIDVVFHAGTVHQSQRLVASMTGKLLKEGSSSFNSEHIAYQLDFHGAYLDFTNGYHYSTVSLYCLNKHLPKLLPLLASILHDPIFPEKEFEVILANRKQDFLINQKKVKMLASKVYNQLLWGNNHPYAQHAIEEDFNTLNTDLLKAFYSTNYTSANCTIYVAGMINSQVISNIDKYLCVGWNNGQQQGNPISLAKPKSEKYEFCEQQGVQSAIKMGRHVMGKDHPDFPAFQLLNTVLGGYFGSRLMHNIREDKGYTYGIGSYVITQPMGSYLVISTETANEHREKVLDEINNELHSLQTTLVPNKELQMVKNYLGGEMMRGFDGPFAILDVYRSLSEMQLDFDYIKYYLEAIENTSPEQILNLANTWLNPDDMYVAIAGA